MEALAMRAQAYPLAMDLKPILLQNRTRQGFITSDNPVVFYNQLLEARDFASNTGLQSVGLQIFLPISPAYAVFFLDEDVYGVGRRRSSFLEITNPNDVHQLNELQTISAAENIYFNSAVVTSEYVLSVRERTSGKRRKQKAHLHVQEEPSSDPETTRELIGISQQDIRNDLNLSVIKVLKKASRARDDLMSRFVMRKPAWVKHFEMFREAVKAGKYTAADFMQYMHDVETPAAPSVLEMS